jgi:hypothetical protein
VASESARATTAAEGRFRIQAPNSSPRSVAVVAVDAEGAALAEDLAALPWQGASFWHWRDFAPDAGAGLAAFLADLGGRTRRVMEVVEAADLVVLLAAPGDSLALPAIAEAIAARRVPAAAMLLAREAEPAAMSAALARLRPHVGMLVVVQDRDYAAAMLEALRA